jgi:hypothetical protein
MGPGKAHALVKLHDWRGRAIYVYHLVMGEHKRIDKPTADEWSQFANAGEPIAYPERDHESSDTHFWVQYGKDQAARLGLQVGE